MIKSMTGYGRIETSSELCNLTVEIKSVNSKYCDIIMRLPRIFSMQEIPLKNMIQQKLQRGKIEIFIDAKFQAAIQSPVLNKPNFLASMSVLEQMKKLGGLKDPIRLEHLLSFNDLVEYESSKKADEAAELLSLSIEKAAALVEQMRENEGSNLETQIETLLMNLENYCTEVEKAKEGIYNYWVERFKTRMQEFGVEDSKERIVQEAAIFVEKADITEEIGRVQSHISQFRKIMKNDFPCGKKLDFLCQELYREWNTIASKSTKADIINTVVEAKSTVDSIREQVQNIV